MIDTDLETDMVSKMCIVSGYVTNSFMKIGSDTMEQLRDQVPKVVYDNRFEDTKSGMVWIPFMQSHEKAAMYPIADTEGGDNFKWQISQIRKLNEQERKNYPILDKPGEFYDSFVDFDNAENFPEKDFETAFDRFFELSLEGIVV